MSPTDSRSHRLPRAGVDPISDERTALELLRAAAARPPRHEILLVLLDGARRGLGLAVVSGTVDADAVVDVAARVLDPAVHCGRVEAVIVATVRPDSKAVDSNTVDLGDADRWLELDEIAAHHGIELVEWFVITGGVSRPRELIGAAARW